jgi:hypothetical protein
MCDAIKDSVFAVGTFGCLKVADLPTREICQKAALAGALMAKAACITRLGVGAGLPPEVGDPEAPEDMAFRKDAEAIVDEWKALDKPPN